jgi:hypothetical protein
MQSASAIILAMLLAPVPISANAQDAPYAMKWQEDDLIDVKRIDVIVMVDDLSIYKVTVNKGNCQIATTFDGAVELSVNDMAMSLGKILTNEPLDPLPQTTNPNAGLPLSGAFGDKLSVFVPISCNILLVEVDTSHGMWTTRFNP